MQEERMDGAWLLFGPPGTGKTTSLTRHVERAADVFGAENVLVCSYTRAAAHEIASRLPGMPKRNVGTLHSVCFHALDCPDLVEGNEDGWNKRYPQWTLTVRKKRGGGDAEAGEVAADRIDDPFESNESTKGDGLRGVMDLLRVRRVPQKEWHVNLRPFHEAFTAWKKENDLLDFTDLLEAGLREFSSAPGNPAAIFFDEAQDASRLQTELLAQWGSEAKRLVLAGDDDQAIFFWAGADAKSFLDFPVGEGQRKYLRQSYRLPARVHERSQAWARRLSHRENKEFTPRDYEGVVKRHWGTWKLPEPLIEVALAYAEQGKSVMFEGTCSYMIEPLKAVLRRRGIPFHNPWRTKRGDWNPLSPGGPGRTMPADRLLSFLRPDRESWGDEAGLWTRHDLWGWASLLEADGVLNRGAKKALLAMKKENEPATGEEISDLFLPEILAEMDELPMTTHPDCVRALQWWVGRMLEREKKKFEYPVRVYQEYGAAGLKNRPLITIGTGHSLKGSEADVVIMFPDLSKAGWLAWFHSQEARQGIIRLFYVMMTRAREDLIVSHPASVMHLDPVA